MEELVTRKVISGDMQLPRGAFLQLASLGINHLRARQEVRDCVSFTAEHAVAFQAKLAVSGIARSLVLSTCNRCEVFIELAGTGVAGELEIARARELFAAEFPEVDLTDVLAVRTGSEALVYLFRIAAGLESMIFGEYQILGQVKEAHQAALDAGRMGGMLDRVVREAITCAKCVKTELDIGAVPPSVCKAGMEYVDRLAGIAGKHVFVIGSGRTGTMAAKFAKRCGAVSIAVCNRNRERTKRLVEEVGARVVDYSARHAAIATSDIVISATASPHLVICAERLELTRPVVFLDLASPRDVEPSVAANPLATLVSIDTIGELASGDRLERERLTEKGMEIVKAALVGMAKGERRS